MSDIMAHKEIGKDFFKKMALTVPVAAVLFYWAALKLTRDGKADGCLV